MLGIALMGEREGQPCAAGRPGRSAHFGISIFAQTEFLT